MVPRVLVLGLWLLAVPREVGASNAERVVLPIAFHVVEVEGQPIVDSGFIAQRLERANQIFAPHGVVFEQTAALALGSEHAAIETREDRDALGANAGHGVIDCFVVRSLRDVDDPTQVRRGVHWHVQAHAGAHFVILSSISGPNVLAHELGHFLGNPEHSQVPGNLMSYLPGKGLPTLDPAQVKRVARSVRGYLLRHELRAVSSAPL
jgi:hypothetical protein